MFESTSELRFAVLIDADNISEKYVKVVLDEISNAGVATYKRIYGDWTSPRLASWEELPARQLDHPHAAVQLHLRQERDRFRDDLIDAMDILGPLGTVDGFAIVSSDSDFTRLVARLRESGMVVIGMGEQRRPSPSSPHVINSSTSIFCMPSRSRPPRSRRPPRQTTAMSRPADHPSASAVGTRAMPAASPQRPAPAMTLRTTARGRSPLAR